MKIVATKSGRAVLAGVALALLLSATGCSKLRARDQLNQGVQAYKASHFETAEQHFRNAIDLDPELRVAQLYLATACFSQYAPGVDSADNMKKANCAIEQYLHVLEVDPGNVLSAKGLASIYFNMKKWDEAKKWNEKAISLDPRDPENYYSVAVIEWTQSYLPRKEKRLAAGINDDKLPIKDKKLCAEVKEMNEQRVNDGIEKLNKAMSLRKDYEDAMSYLNLLYRERADIQCGDEEARKADLDKADELVAKVMDIKQAKLKKAGEQHGIVLDQPQNQ